MIKNSVLLILSISISLLPAILVEEDSFQGFLYNQAASCEYDNWISHIAEGIADEGYNVYAPYDRQTNGFGDFYEPDEMETAQWEIVLTFFNNENYDDTDFYLDYYGIPYQVVEFQDTDTGRTYYLLREYPNYEYYDDNGTPDITADDENGAFDYGWGLFVYNPSSPLPVIITAPHPNDDYLTSAMACHCFQEWNARYLLIAGAGREVKWTENGTYSNSKSLSDPSRNEDHPFNIPYNYFCDRIRADWGCREFSAQIHSYDWNRHDGYANCQISAGYSKGCPNLPIRDLSDLKIDIINASNHLMLPANTVGNNQPVYLNDYYAVNYNLYEFTFSDGDTTYAVNNDVDLPGYSQNQQMLYSFQNWNRYDVFEPFFHIEMDELPESYAQTEENWKWFYAYDPDSGTFDMDNLFTLVLQYYNGWTAALLSVLPTVFELDDSLIPAEPQNFTFLAQGYDTISLGWEFISSFDFNTYEILYTTGSDIPTEYTVIDRVDYSILASQRANMVTVQNLSGNQHYFFRLQAVDYNNNYSLASPEINTYTSPAEISALKAIGRDALAIVTWIADNQTRNLGFKVYRRTGEGNYVLHADYHSNPELLGSSLPGQNYEFFDYEVENYENYTYKIAAVNELEMEFLFPLASACSPAPIYSLIVSAPGGIVSDSASFSANEFASNGYDVYYDLFKEDAQPPDYIYTAFHEKYWSTGMKFQLETHSLFDPQINYKSWDFILATDLIGETLSLNVSDNYDRDGEKLYLLDELTDELFNLASEEVIVTPTSQDTLYFTLYWGNLKPIMFIFNKQNRIYQAGETVEIDWSTYFPSLVQSYAFSLQNDTDSIMVSENVVWTVNHLNWPVPDNLEMHNANVVVDLKTVHNENIRVTSSYALGIVPQINEFAGEAGWITASQPWPDECWQVEETFGNGARSFQFTEPGVFLETDTFSFDAGYWLYLPEAIAIQLDALIFGTEYSRGLVPGWNLVPNPHFCTYRIKDISFAIDGEVESFRDVVAAELISRAVYVYDEDRYKQTEFINPLQSFFICSEMETPVSVVLEPYNDSFEMGELYDWKLPLLISQSGADGDELILGTSPLTADSFDFYYDLPEPPVKPFHPAVACYFPKDSPADSLFLYERLNSEFKKTLSADEPEEKIWCFTLNLEIEAPLQISGDFSEFPVAFRCWISLMEQEVLLVPGDILMVMPPCPGSFPGEISIRNQDFVAVDNNITVIKELTNYPNPFNPSTVISFYLGKNSRVLLNVYNIKGQKVRNLENMTLRCGYYRFEWDGRDENRRKVASGVYFLKLEAAGKTIIRKMMLLK